MGSCSSLATWALAYGDFIVYTCNEHLGYSIIYQNIPCDCYPLHTVKPCGYGRTYPARITA